MMFWEEIWGCVKYIGLPYETVMSMPVRNRKIWINRHNMEGDIKKEMEERKNGVNKISGEALNTYAGMEQSKAGKNLPYQ